MSIVVCAFALTFTLSCAYLQVAGVHSRLILSKAKLVTEQKALKFSNRRVFFVFIGKASYSFRAVVFRSLLCIRTDFHAVMRFTASHWFTDSIYPFKRFTFLLLFPKTEYYLSSFKKMRCFDKKKGQINSCKIVPHAGDQTTHSVQLHSISALGR